MSFYKNKILYFIISCYVTCISLYATDIVRPKSTDSIGDKLITNQCNENNYIEIKDRLNTDSYISNTSKMLTKYIMKNTPPHPYEPREILYIDSYSGGKYVLKMNELQFKKYNFNKLTKQISKLSKYYKKQNIQFKKMQNNLQVKKGLINDVSVQFYKKFYIRKNEELYYYMDLLDYLIEGNDKLNTDINN